MKNAAYLDPTVKIEPLVDGWYAWPHLLAPVQQAMNLAYRYLPMASSFTRAPTVHVAASHDPAMFGGPFIDLPIEAVPAVRSYLERTERDRARALSFVKDFKEFDARLQSSADGYSLSEWYDNLPTSMRGLVELVYDLNNHPKIRILEEMFERDDLGHSEAQSVLLHRQPDHDRTFFLSTPRLDIEGSIAISRPFADPAIGRLCASRSNPVDIATLAHDLHINADELKRYFCYDPPPRPQGRRYTGDDVRVRYFGHACLVIESRSLAIVIDPTCAWDDAPLDRHFTFNDFPDKIDALILSHCHQDHFSPETLLQLRDRVGVVVIPPHNRGQLEDPSPEMMLRRLGYESVVTLPALARMSLPDGGITALPFSGEHADLDIHSKQCLLIELNGRRVGVFIDSDAVDPDVYDRLSPLLADLDLMFMGMECSGAPFSWLYGPLNTAVISNRNDNSRRLSGANCARAWRLTQAIRPRSAYVYAMGQEPWLRFLMGLSYKPDSVQLRESDDFVSRCNAIGVPAERLYGHLELTI
jgi:L-ascorbate metabolism protein UlaG (beta-lactamase superfamily)